MNYLKISEFSRLSGLSVDQLRICHKAEVLLPCKIDNDNNYRYYSEEQLGVADLILKLKTISFTNNEIKDYISSDIFARTAMIDRKKCEFNQICDKVERVSEKLLAKENNYPHILFVGTACNVRRINSSVCKEIIAKNGKKKILIIDQNLYSDLEKEYYIISEPIKDLSLTMFNYTKMKDYIMSTKLGNVDLILLALSSKDWLRTLIYDSSKLEVENMLRKKLLSLVKYDLIIINYLADNIDENSRMFMKIACSAIVTVSHQAYYSNESRSFLEDMKSLNKTCLICPLDDDLNPIHAHIDSKSELLKRNMERITERIMEAFDDLKVD